MLPHPWPPGHAWTCCAITTWQHASCEHTMKEHAAVRPPLFRSRASPAADAAAASVRCRCQPRYVTRQGSTRLR